MENNKLSKALMIATGSAAVIACGFAAGIVYGLKKWAKDEESDSLKIALGKRGLEITKGGEEGSFCINTKYDWENDPDFADDEEDEDEDEDDDLIEDAVEIPAVEEVPAEEEAPAEE